MGVKSWAFVILWGSSTACGGMESEPIVMDDAPCVRVCEARAPCAAPWAACEERCEYVGSSSADACAACLEPIACEDVYEGACEEECSGVW